MQQTPVLKLVDVVPPTVMDHLHLIVGEIAVPLTVIETDGLHTVDYFDQVFLVQNKTSLSFPRIMLHPDFQIILTG